jgi:deazaflavin-dependent oxidoreductase (nitroreductase family)
MVMGFVKVIKSWGLRLRAGLEYFIVARLTPKRVGRLMRLVFKTPVWLYRLGLHWLAPRGVLILVTTGRRTGKIRLTALEYGYDPERREYFLMSGWGGQSDWYRNARANPRVEIWRGRLRQRGLARSATDEEVVQVMLEVLAVNPGAARIWSSHSGVKYNGTRESLHRMAPAFPSLLVKVEE